MHVHAHLAHKRMNARQVMREPFIGFIPLFLAFSGFFAKSGHGRVNPVHRHVYMSICHVRRAPCAVSREP